MWSCWGGQQGEISHLFKCGDSWSSRKWVFLCVTLNSTYWLSLNNIDLCYIMLLAAAGNRRCLIIISHQHYWHNTSPRYSVECFLMCRRLNTLLICAFLISLEFIDNITFCPGESFLLLFSRSSTTEQSRRRTLSLSFHLIIIVLSNSTHWGGRTFILFGSQNIFVYYNFITPNRLRLLLLATESSLTTLGAVRGKKAYVLKRRRKESQRKQEGKLMWNWLGNLIRVVSLFVVLCLNRELASCLMMRL